jgi:hypothetical protein
MAGCKGLAQQQQQQQLTVALACASARGMLITLLCGAVGWLVNGQQPGLHSSSSSRGWSCVLAGRLDCQQAGQHGSSSYGQLEDGSL